MQDVQAKERSGSSIKYCRYCRVITHVLNFRLVPGAHKGEGLGNAFLSHIRETDAIFQVVRAFEDPNVSHTEIDVDPVRDLDIIYTELLLKDLEYC